MPLIYAGPTYVNTTDPLYIGDGNQTYTDGVVALTQNTQIDTTGTFNSTGTTNFTNVAIPTAFNAIPTSSVVPTSASQLVNKAYVDGALAVVPTLNGANAFTGNTNTFNSNLPTSTLTPTASNQFITKTYADATYGTLFTATATAPASTTVTIVSIPVAANTYVNIFGWFMTYQLSNTDTCGFFNIGVRNSGTSLTANNSFSTTYNTLSPITAISGTNLLIQGGGANIGSIKWKINYFILIS